MNDFLQFKLGETLTVGKVLTAVLIVLIGFIIVKLFARIVKKMLEKSHWDQSLKNVVIIVVRVLADAIVVLVALDYIGIPITSALTVLSVVGLAVSLAIQDTLANVFSGMLLLAANTFSSGDYVQLNGLEGTVLRVDLMNTHLRTADNKTVRIPNNEVQTSPIINFSREPIRRVELRLHVPYDNDTDTVKAALLRAAAEAEAVLDDPAPFTGLSAYESGGIQYVLQAWTDTSTYWPAYYQLTEGVRRIFKEEGLTLSYDHINVHMIRESKEEN